MKNIVQIDEEYVWHPYTQHGRAEPRLPVKQAQGAYLELENGTQVLDAISSWWVNLLGHRHPKIISAIEKQLHLVEHVLFAGFTHAPAVELAQTLIESTRKKGASFSRVFYSDNGSTSVEIALKMAFQSYKNRGDLKRNKFLALHHSYHGDTFGAMAVGAPNGFHPCFQTLLAEVDFVPAGNINLLKKTLSQSGEYYAGFIVEPLIQGAGGMKIHSPEFLNQAIELCKQYGILVIFDEVFTGFYRTGTAFAFEQCSTYPDFLCLSKGITGGYLPLAVTLTTTDVFESFQSSELSQAFLHGHSYTANPLACAAALATWQELHTDFVQNQIKMIATITQESIRQFRDHPLIHETRHLGTIGAIELKGESSYFTEIASKIRSMALQKGVLLRPLGNVIYCVPPYCISEMELRRVYQSIFEILHELGSFPLPSAGSFSIKNFDSFDIIDV